MPVCPAQEFNKGLFDYLIATDDVHSASHDREADEDGDHPEGSREEAVADGGGEATAGGKVQKKGKKRKQRTERDEEFGVTR